MWDSSNVIVYRLMADVLFLKIRKLLGDHQTESVKSLSKIPGNELSNNKVKS